jgi:hypothetical protein
MKRIISTALLAAGLWLGVAAPAGAMIINGSTAVSIGNPDLRVAVVGNPECSAEGGMQPCIAEGAFIIQIRVATEGGRS